METTVLMIFAHCIGDMILQNDFMKKYKGKSLLPFLSHIFIYTGTMILMMEYLGIYNPTSSFILFFSHFAIDSWKSTVPKDQKHWNCLYYDQAMHLFFVVLVTFM